jgi:hypothetical protein
MNMRRSGVGSGGGIGMNKNVQVPVKTGSGSKGVGPGWVGQRGNLQGSHTTDGKETSYRGEPKFTGKNFQQTKFGNEIAASTKCGPGGSRDVYKFGSQMQYGSGGPPKPAGRDILSEYGSDYKSPRGDN